MLVKYKYKYLVQQANMMTKYTGETWIIWWGRPFDDRTQQTITYYTFYNNYESQTNSNNISKLCFKNIEEKKSQINIYRKNSISEQN